MINIIAYSKILDYNLISNFRRLGGMRQELTVEEVLGHKIYYFQDEGLKVFIYDRLVRFENGTPYVELPLLNTTFKKITKNSIMIYPVELDN